jgi:putative ABC transport system substrate-binding protein
MRRRIFIALAGALAAWPLAVLAQKPPAMARIGFLYFRSRQSAMESGRHAAFLEGLRELGYVEGKNYTLDARYADGGTERLPGLAAELVQAKVNVLVVTGTPAVHAAQKATNSIPIVITVAADPVAEGFAANLSRPGGNLTGLVSLNTELGPKQLELILDCVPKVSRIAVLWNSNNTAHPRQVQAIQAAAHKRKKNLLQVDGRTPAEIERGFAAMTREHAQAVLIVGDSFFVQQMRQIAQLALKHRLPSVYVIREYVDAGGFASYGSDTVQNFRRAPVFVDKILKGAKPGELPFEQPMRFELAFNLKTSKALGIKIPETLLQRAHRVVE